MLTEIQMVNHWRCSYLIKQTSSQYQANSQLFVIQYNTCSINIFYSETTLLSCCDKVQVFIIVLSQIAGDILLVFRVAKGFCLVSCCGLPCHVMSVPFVPDENRAEEMIPRSEQ